MTKEQLIDDIMTQLQAQARDKGKVELSQPYSVRARLQLFNKAELQRHLEAKPNSPDRLCEVAD